MANRTPLYESHLALGAKMVDFAGWEMPIHYGSQIDEHHQVRHSAGMFDVSHMVVVDLHGTRVRDFLRYLLANDVARLDGHPGKALYSCMLNEKSGVIDDLIVYYMDSLWYRMVVNAATRDKDLAWIMRHAEDFDIRVHVRDDLEMVAVQGPEARAHVHAVLDEAARVAELPRFAATEVGDWFIARTGYTGEDGYEIILPTDDVEPFWLAMLEAGVAPCGLGARDTLRLEAGMALYGQDMDEESSPLASGLGWTISWDDAERDFIGRAPLQAERQRGSLYKGVALLLEGKGVLRAHQRVYINGGEGEITSGTFSPTLGKAIALARIPVGDDEVCEVEVRTRRLSAKIVKAPFVRNGKSLVD